MTENRIITKKKLSEIITDYYKKQDKRVLSSELVFISLADNSSGVEYKITSDSKIAITSRLSLLSKELVGE